MSYKEDLAKLFEKKTVTTMKEVTKIIGCSHDTLEKFLKEQGFYSSSNKNGKYYILEKSCKFDDNGLFFYEQIMFSKCRTLKNSVFNFVNRSEKGVSTADVIKIFGVNSKTSLSNLHTNKEISWQMYNGVFYYFSGDMEIGLHQRELRKIFEEAKTKTSTMEYISEPNPSISIAVLTAVAIETGANAKRIKKHLEKRGLNISLLDIEKVCKYYNIPEKKN